MVSARATHLCVCLGTRVLVRRQTRHRQGMSTHQIREEVRIERRESLTSTELCKKLKKFTASHVESIQHATVVSHLGLIRRSPFFTEYKAVAAPTLP